VPASGEIVHPDSPKLKSTGKGLMDKLGPTTKVRTSTNGKIIASQASADLRSSKESHPMLSDAEMERKVAENAFQAKFKEALQEKTKQEFKNN